MSEEERWAQRMEWANELVEEEVEEFDGEAEKADMRRLERK